MKYLLIMCLTLLASCGFNSSDEEGQKEQRSIDTLNAQRSSQDSDGDLVNDQEEINKGRSPYVADIPKVKVNFLQNYNIKQTYEDQTIFEIDTRTAKDDPDFKYRVGELFLKENSINNAAKLGRFSGVTWGNIRQEDYSWVKYPEIDEKFYFSKRAEYEDYKNKKLSESQITLENTLKLVESPHFNSIEGLELNFYYYSYSKETYIQLHTQKIEQIFQSGVREDFVITITNPPKELLDDTYMRHGEFIISEVKDFYIPDLKMTYRELLASVKAKTVPVYKTSPFENDLNYIAVSKSGDSLINVLSHLYSEKFEIQEDKLTRLEQFSNNLPSFKYLHELKAEDKSGQWFVMTNSLKQHYLKHQFTNKDSITLSYITGNQLSRRTSEIIPAFREKVYSGSKDKTLPLGNVTKNSKVALSLYLDSIKGVKLLTSNEQFAFAPSCRGNCTGANWNVWAKFSNNRFENKETPWVASHFSEILPSFDLFINNTQLSVNDLIKDNILSLSLESDNRGQYLYLEIKNLHKLDLIQSGQENTAFIKIKPLSSGVAGEGLEIKEVGGHNIDKYFHAGLICVNQAAERNIPLAVTSWGFDKWQHRVRWGVKVPPKQFIPTRGEKKKYFNGVVVDIISKVTNFYN